jgi:hypothetical protein
LCGRLYCLLILDDTNVTLHFLCALFIEEKMDFLIFSLTLSLACFVEDMCKEKERRVHKTLLFFAESPEIVLIL